jgi:hypothetical protein
MPPFEALIDYKKKKSNFTAAKAISLNQEIEVNITSHEKN